MALEITAGTWLMAGAAGLGAVAGYAGSKSQANAITDANAAQIEANKVDPRITDKLFGNGTRKLKSGVAPTYSDPDSPGWFGRQNNPDSDYETSGGLIDRYQGLLDKPQNGALANYGNDLSQVVGEYGAGQTMNSMRAAAGLQAGNTPAPTMNAAQVNAPVQNGMNLSGSYDKFINGPAGANPYLTGAIQKGINQSSNAFGNMISDAKAATQDVLGSVRGGAVAAGQYGGSRQGIAEGKAIESMNTQLGRAASQFGQNNTDAAVAAQAGAYNDDSNRALSATQGLGAQQYGVAGQNASMAQDASHANLNAGLTTNALNSANTATGINASQGLLDSAYKVAGAQDQYDINKATNVNGLLSPYLSKNGTPTQLTPAYANTAGAALGGAATGIGLYNQLKGSFSGGGDKPPAWDTITSGYGNGTGY